MRQRAAQMLLYPDNQRFARKARHIHYAATEDHRIRIEQIYTGGNGAGCMIQELLYEGVIGYG